MLARDYPEQYSVHVIRALLYALGQAKEFEQTIIKLLKKYFSASDIFAEIVGFM